jgi:hypothetical protein
MRITDLNAIRRGFLHAELKVILLNPTLCAAYSGTVAMALPAIRRIASDEMSLEQAKAHLFEAHKQSNGQTDFLLASLSPPTLTVIKEGLIRESDAGWLGDQPAFNEYQRHYSDAKLLLPRDAFESDAEFHDIEFATRMGEAMDAVVHGAHFVGEGEARELTMPEGGSYEGVGEARVMVVPRAEDKLFGYAHQNRALASTVAKAGTAQTERVQADFGSAERGSLAVFMLTPTQPGVGAIGLYFLEGELGLLYAPLVRDKPEPYPSVSVHEFCEQVHLKRGIELGGLVGPLPC